MSPKQRLEKALARVAELKAHQGDFTPEQVAEIDQLDATITSARADIATNDRTQNTLKSIADAGDTDRELDDTTAGLKSGRAGAVLDLKSDAMIRGLAAGMLAKSATVGRKALTPSGESVGAVEVATSPVALGKRAAGLLDLIPVIPNSPSRFEFLRQTERALNAAVVAVGERKPTSPFAFEKIDGALAVVAHLSDPIDQYLLQDLPALEQFVSSELIYGLVLALEALVMDDAEQGIFTTTGVREQEFAVDKITSTRKAITQLEAVGLEPTGFALSPADWEALELSRTSGSGVLELVDSPVDRAARRLHGLPVAVTAGLPAGRGVLLSRDSVALRTDAGVAVRWSENVSDDFELNQIRARAELRARPQIGRPSGIVVIETEATTP